MVHSPNITQVKQLTAVCDVETSARHGVVSLELQLQNIWVGSQMGGHFGPCETVLHGRAQLVAILHGQEVIGRLQVKVIECQVDTTAWLWDDEPHTIQIVAITLWVVRRQHRPLGCCEVGETWNYGSGGDTENTFNRFVCFYYMCGSYSGWSHSRPYKIVYLYIER